MSTRRQFLQQSALVSLAPWLPAFLPQSLSAAEAAEDDRILVVIQLDGGNDGLNTVIPFRDEHYAAVRSTLRLAEKDLHKLDDAVALHPGMKAAAELFGDGRLSIVQGVGYPNPNRSHFESMSIWQHARLDESQHDSLGWLGRAADAHPVDPLRGPDAVYVGREDIPVAIRGRRSNAVSLADESDLQLMTPLSLTAAATKTDDLTAFVQRSVSTSYDAAKRFAEAEGKSTTSDATYPTNALAQKLQLAARMIKLGGGTRVFYVSQPGYDTHSAQVDAHRRLLNEFSRGLKAFLDDLHASKLEERVVVLAFSEFGRRVQENGSAGTDHGAAGPVFLAGRPVAGGVLGPHPSLTDLDNGDLKMSTDFRDIYATLLTEWLRLPANELQGRPSLPLLANRS
ncbi:MAG: DUF1501 domain-containing protein [Planctomycetaceae bacterium]